MYLMDCNFIQITSSHHTRDLNVRNSRATNKTRSPVMCAYKHFILLGQRIQFAHSSPYFHRPETLFYK